MCAGVMPMAVLDSALGEPVTWLLCSENYAAFPASTKSKNSFLVIVLKDEFQVLVLARSVLVLVPRVLVNIPGLIPTKGAVDVYWCMKHRWIIPITAEHRMVHEHAVAIGLSHPMSIDVHIRQRLSSDKRHRKGFRSLPLCQFCYPACKHIAPS